jgi:chorismate mutase/prephenate dehydratase
MAAYEAVEKGECECAVLPIENSIGGDVAQVLDLAYEGSLSVTGIYELEIEQNLLGVPGATTAGLREVVSHPQALSQCAAYIREHGLIPKEFENTARAAKFVADQNSPHLAAIASDETAKLYGLQILEKGINEKNINTTRFAVLTRAAVNDESKSGKHSILMFTVRNEAGALAQAINIIGKYGYNMRCLRSRPMKELLWQYYFYAEAEGDLNSPEGRQMMKEIEPYCDRLKMLGSFRYPAELK